MICTRNLPSGNGGFSFIFAIRTDPEHGLSSLIMFNLRTVHKAATLRMRCWETVTKAFTNYRTTDPHPLPPLAASDLGNILRFCWQPLQCKWSCSFQDFSNLGFYWFYLLYIFQKFLSVLVCWWNSSWFFSTSMDIFILLCSFISKRFLRGWREVSACAQAASHNCLFFEWFSPNRLHIKISLEALKIHSHWITTGWSALADLEWSQGSVIF